MRRGPTDPLSVLVTGAGAPVGVSIFKALRQSTLNPRIVATDSDPSRSDCSAPTVHMFFHVLPTIRRAI